MECCISIHTDDAWQTVYLMHNRINILNVRLNRFTEFTVYTDKNDNAKTPLYLHIHKDTIKRRVIYNYGTISIFFDITPHS